METVGLGFYFDDLPIGRQFRTIGRTVTEADITNFVNCTGMVEVLFTNLEFLANEAKIKRRLAPAALVYAFAESLLVQSTMQHAGLAFLHMELNVENPVFAGDKTHAECEIIAARRSLSRDVAYSPWCGENTTWTPKPLDRGYAFDIVTRERTAAPNRAQRP